jgi:hypothetical protein
VKRRYEDEMRTGTASENDQLSESTQTHLTTLLFFFSILRLSSGHHVSVHPPRPHLQQGRSSSSISYDTEHPEEGEEEEGVVEDGRGGMLSPTFWLNRTWEPFAITTQEGRSRTRAGEGTKPSRNGNRRKTVSGEASGFDSEPRGGEL